MRVGGWLAFGALAVGCAQPPGPVPSPEPAQPARLAPQWETEQVGSDADDPALWVHPTDPSKSLILGTDKTEGKGGIYVFDAQGKTVQHIAGLDRPNNIDVEYGFDLGGKPVDIAVATERMTRRLRVYAIDGETGKLSEVSGETAVFQGREGEAGAPMGIGLWKTPSGEVHAFVSPKTGPKTGYLAQYRLVARGGKVDVEHVRDLGEFSGSGEIEAVLVDDEDGRVYYSDEEAGIRWAWCDPAKTGGGIFAEDGYEGDREGLAVWPGGPGGTCIVSSDQVKGGSRVFLYPRGGGPALAMVETASDDTDGLEVSARPWPGHPEGILVMMNSRGKNFMVYDLAGLRKAAAK
jgi:3-phytase